MGCDCARTLPQWILSTVNFILLFVSLVFLFLGLIFSFAPDQVIYLLGHISNSDSWQAWRSVVAVSRPAAVEDAGLLFIGVSLVLLPPSLLGYIGALRMNSILLLIYLVPLLGVWSCQLLFLTCLPLLKSRLTSLLNWGAALSLQYYRGENAEPNLMTLGWNHLMASMSCCGFHNFTDFQSSSSYLESRIQHQIVPAPCCILDSRKYPEFILPRDSHCIFTPTSYNSYFIKGCYQELSHQLMAHLDIIVIAVISLLTAEILLVILSACLCLLQKDGKNIHTVVIRDMPRSHAAGRNGDMKLSLPDA